MRDFAFEYGSWQRGLVNAHCHIDLYVEESLQTLSSSASACRLRPGPQAGQLLACR